MNLIIEKVKSMGIYDNTKNDKSSLDIVMPVDIILRGPIDSESKNTFHIPQTNKTIEASIPNKISIGEKVRLKGCGISSTTGKTGDLFLEIVAIDYPDVTISKEFHSNLPDEITLYLSHLKKKVRVTIPQHLKSDSNFTLKLEGLGLPQQNSSNGNLYVCVTVKHKVDEKNMNLKSLHCPNCGGTIETEDGLDMFYCKYCGHKIVLESQSPAAYKAKTKIKRMKHEEKLQDKQNAHERYKMEFEAKQQNIGLFIALGLLVTGLLIIFIFIICGNASVARQEKELQSIVDEIMIDIEEGDFDEAYIKANSLYWDDSWTSEGEQKWNKTRKEILKQIKEAEKEASKESSENNSGVFNWFN